MFTLCVLLFSCRVFEFSNTVPAPGRIPLTGVSQAGKLTRLRSAQNAAQHTSSKRAGQTHHTSREALSFGHANTDHRTSHVARHDTRRRAAYDVEIKILKRCARSQHNCRAFMCAARARFEVMLAHARTQCAGFCWQQCAHSACTATAAYCGSVFSVVHSTLIYDKGASNYTMRAVSEYFADHSGDTHWFGDCCCSCCCAVLFGYQTACKHRDTIQMHEIVTL